MFPGETRCPHGLYSVCSLLSHSWWQCNLGTGSGIKRYFIIACWVFVFKAQSFIGDNIYDLIKNVDQVESTNKKEKYKFLFLLSEKL